MMNGICAWNELRDELHFFLKNFFCVFLLRVLFLQNSSATRGLIGWKNIFNGRWTDDVFNRLLNNR